MRPQSPPRATWRRANSAISSAAARASTPKTWSIVCALTGVWARPKRSVAAGTKVSATQPEALFTRMCTGPSSASAASKRAGTLAASDRSASIAAARPPAARMDSATKSARAIRVARYAAGSDGSSRPPSRSLRK